MPAPVRLALAGTLGLALSPLACGAPEGAFEVLVRCGHEASVGLLVGMGAALPFDGARMGGRLIDLVRGTSAEAALPVAGHRESRPEIYCSSCWSRWRSPAERSPS